MPKMRGIKPEFWTDEKVVTVSPLARLLFVGMWNYACDNGHVDDSPVQLKMRILPADNCDAADLITELVNVGLVIRKDGYLKAPNLPVHQNIDRRFLVFCAHCAHDEHAALHDTDRIVRTTSKAPHRAPVTTSARRVHDERPTSARSEGEGEGEGEGEQTREPNGSRGARKRATAPPENFQPSDRALAWQREKYPHIDAAAETVKFVNSHRARGNTFKDLDAAWRNWIIKADEFARRDARHLSAVPTQPWTPPPGSPLSYVEM